MKIRKIVIVREQELLISIGVHAQEKLAPQRILVNAEVEIEGSLDEMDSLDQTFDYDGIRDLILAQRASAHSELQETVARRILNGLLSRPGVFRAIVETRKPDIFDDCAYVGVRLEASA